MILTRLAVAAVAAACCYMSGLEIVNRLQGSLIPAVDPMDSALALAAEERWAEARLMAEFISHRPELGDTNAAEELAAEADEQLSSFWSRAERFAHGAVTGEPTDLASMLGSLSLDLFVVGDIRDLAVQGWKEFSYGTGDSLILALSAVGLGTTLAPHIDWAPALLKALRRTGALTERFAKALTRTGRQALQTGDYGKLSRTVADFGGAARRLGPGPLRGVMRSVDSAEDLAKVARAAQIDARGTYALSRLFGKDGVKWISRDGGNVGVLVSSIKVGSRLTKAVRKSTVAMPTSWLVIALAASIAALAAVSVPRSRRRAGPRQAQNRYPATATLPPKSLVR